MAKDPGSELAPDAQHVMGGAIPAQHQWFGHPRGLSTLFFTEFWERFSYYGMRALLVLFMTAAIANGGLAMSDATAGAIYGLYTSGVYLLALPGGWVADKLWGQRKAVFVGGCIIAAGHFSMAIPMTFFFFFGLVLIVIGTGLLKPNVSTMVGDLYPIREGDATAGARRDAGFSIFYMGINFGALLGPLACGYMGERIDWHLGFSLAGIGMVAGLIQYKLGGKYLGQAGVLQSDEPLETLIRRQRNFYLVAGLAALGVVVVAGLLLRGLGLGLTQFATYVGYAIIVIALGFFVYLLLRPELTKVEKQRVVVMLLLFIFAAVFWSGFEQAGSSMNLFAERWTDRVILGWEMPTTFLQSVNPVFIILLAPVFGWLWVSLGRNNPNIPLKFALGLLLLSSGFFVLAWGAANASEENLVTPAWLVVTYFLHTCGELCLSPVGLSSFTKLAPRGRVGQMMGIWFIAAALGNLFAGLVAGGLEDLPAGALFRQVAIIIGGIGVFALLVSPFVKRLTGGIK